MHVPFENSNIIHKNIFKFEIEQGTNLTIQYHFKHMITRWVHLYYPEQPRLTLLQSCGFTSSFGRHCTGIAEVTDSYPFKSWFLFQVGFCSLKS